MKLENQIYPEKPAERYLLIQKQLAALLEGEKDWVANLANAAALLYNALPRINWVGFYRVQDGELLLGPFQGKPACVHIPIGRGVCGTAVAHNTTQLVPDVHCFAGHIACDADSASELVIPLHSNGKVTGVLDIDSPVPNRFNEQDAHALEKITQLISESCVWAN